MYSRILAVVFISLFLSKPLAAVESAGKTEKIDISNLPLGISKSTATSVAETKEAEPAVKPKAKKVVKKTAKTEKKDETAINGQTTHTVTKGDTLWDLSNKYYNNPWKWQEIWNINKESIKNPDMIFPDQIFIIPGEGTTAEPPAGKSSATEAKASNKEEITAIPSSREETPLTEPKEVEIVKQDEETSPEPAAQQEELNTEPPEEPAEEITAPKTIDEEKEAIKTAETSIKENKLGNEIFTVPTNFSFDGKIVDTKIQNQELISQTDIVYLNIGSNSGLKPGMFCGVYKLVGQITDSSGIKYNKIKRAGILKIMPEISGTVSTAMVYRSFEPINKNDSILTGK